MAGLWLLMLAWPMSSAAQGSVVGVYVGNQGNFGDDNGSVTYYDPATQQAVQWLGTLGSTVQSLLLREGQGFVMSDKAGNVDVFDAATGQRTAQVSGVASPRYMAVVGEDKAYVSNLGGFGGSPSTVTILDLNTLSATGTIPVGQNPETIALAGGRVYVANFGFGEDSTLTVIDPATDVVLETLDLGCDGPRFLEVDAQDELWVFCTGKTVYNDDFTEIIEQTDGQVIVLTGATGEEVTRFALDAQIGTSALGQDAFYSPSAREVFVVQGGRLLAFDTDTNTQGAAIPIPGTEAVGAVAYDGAAEQFYLGRIPGYTEAGFVSIHDRAGAEVGRFTTGVAPAAIVLQQAEGVAVEEAGGGPATFALAAAYPNPFNPRTTLPFEIDRPEHVTLTVYTLQGRAVATLVERFLQPGRYEVQWTPEHLASGMYLVRLQAGGQEALRRVVLLK